MIKQSTAEIAAREEFVELDSDQNSELSLDSIPTIRTETVFSRLPFHNLSKGKDVDINITIKGENGALDLQWILAPTKRHGSPRELAYKLDTLIINKHIDEQGRGLTDLIRLGTLREICDELGLVHGGKNFHNLKEAFYQNALTGIQAKLQYNSTDGRRRTFEAAFNRYTVIMTGDQLPGEEARKADAVYIQLNEHYRKLLSSVHFRPLDYAYQKGLTAASQRFYELVSFAIYGALKERKTEARLMYSDYCMRAPQVRYLDRAAMQKQMYKLHQPHVNSGYIGKAVRYQSTVDADGNPDWSLFYIPGPRAKKEFHYFNAKQRSLSLPQTLDGAVTPFALPEPVMPTPSPLVEELVSRGVSEKKARALVENAQPEQYVMDQLEWADLIISQSAVGKIRNPPGLYVHIVECNIPPPAGFESSRIRKLRTAQVREESDRLAEQQRLELAFEEHRNQMLESYIRDRMLEAEYLTIFAGKRKEIVKQFPSLPKATVDDVSHQGVRMDIRRKLPFPSFEEFCRAERARLEREESSKLQGSLF